MELHKQNISRDFFWSKVSVGKREDCWLWKTGHFSTGYGAFKIGKKNYGAHVISFLLSGGTLSKSKPHVLHSCNNRGCVNPAHLRAGSQQDNVNDAIKSGTHGLALKTCRRPHGTKHGMAKLTDAKVRALRSEYEPHRTTRDDLAAKYGISKATVNQILMRKTWKHVE